MKFHFLFCVLISGFLFAQTDSEIQRIKTLMLENFPENIEIKHHDFTPKKPVYDSIYYRFHRPEVEISKDSIRVSYIMEKFDFWENSSPVFEKLEWRVAWKEIEEFYGFEFTFGNWDRFMPNLYYWNFVNDNTKVETTELTWDEFQNNQIPENKTSIDDGSAWFPTKIKSNEELENLVNSFIEN